MLAALGWLAGRSASSKHPMHAAASVALLGFLGSANGLAGVFGTLAGNSAELSMADVAKSLMALILALFIALCVVSFRRARMASD